MPTMMLQQRLRRQLLWLMQVRRVLVSALVASSLAAPSLGHAQESADDEFGAAINEAFSLAESAIWYDTYGDAVRRSMDLALEASQIASANWGEQDVRYLRAASVFSIATSQNMLGIIANAEGDTDSMMESVDAMTTEAGFIAMQETNDGQVALMGILIKARLARVRGDAESATQLYDYVLEMLGQMMPPENPIYVAVSVERDR